MKIKINVTKRHINASYKKITGDCPIERAIQPLLKRGYEVGIGYSVGEIASNSEESHYFKLSVAARTFAVNFDKCENDCRPFSFTVSIPKRYLK